MLDNEQLCKVRGVGGRAEVELGYGVGEQLYLRVIDEEEVAQGVVDSSCLLYTSPSPRD